MPTPVGRTFYLKRGDTAPAIVLALTNADGSVVTLTSATIALKIRREDLSAAAVSRTMTIVSATLGTVTYSWVADDSATPGRYRMYVVVTFPSTKIGTYPVDGHLTLVVLDAL